MDETHVDHSAEPFGQRGVLPYVWPVFVVLCTIGFCTAIIMGHRSWTIWDSISNASSYRQVTVASVIGRLVIDIYPGSSVPESAGSVWSFDTNLFESIQDAWQPSWKKTLGIEWGDESARRFGGQQFTYWRLRIRWRTMAILYAIPVCIELIRRYRKWRHAAHDHPEPAPPESACGQIPCLIRTKDPFDRTNHRDNFRSMVRHLLVGWVCVTLSVGCSSKTVVYNPQKNPDVKRIVIAQYDNVKIQQQYTKSIMEKYPMARALNARRGGSPGAAVAFVIPDPTGGIIAGSILLIGLTAAAAEAETFKRRTERLNVNGLHTTVAPEVFASVQGRLHKLGYAVSTTPPLKTDSFSADKPAVLGKTMPTLENKSTALKQFKDVTKQGDLLLILNTLTMGVEQRDKFGKKPTFHPYVVVGVRGYRTDTGVIAAKFDLVSIAPTPLPITKDLDSAIADKAVLKKAYDEAIALAIDEIVGDFDRSDSAVQLAKPKESTDDKKAKPSDTKAKPSAQSK